MFQTLFIASLFLPVVWRVLMAFVFPSSRHPYSHLAVFVIPLIVVGVPLCLFGLSAGAYGIFIPLMLGTFWTPQLAFIGFFAWCHREDVNRTIDDSNQTLSTTGIER